MDARIFTEGEYTHPAVTPVAKLATISTAIVHAAPLNQVAVANPMSAEAMMVLGGILSARNPDGI